MSPSGANARSQAQSSRRFISVVQHLQAVVAHADRVGVGKGEAQLAAHLPWSLTTAFHSPPTYWAGVCTRGRRWSTIVFQRLVQHGMSPQSFRTTATFRSFFPQAT